MTAKEDKTMWNCTPTPEVMEAFALAEKSGRDIREEMRWLRNNPQLSVRYGITDTQAQHNAVGAKWPHLYTEKSE